MTDRKPDVGVYTGSKSDRPTMHKACEVLDELGISYEFLVLSAHRTPDRMRDFAMHARERGIKVIIAAAGGAAHLPGMMAAWAPTTPVLGVPIGSKSNNVNDMIAMHSIIGMPGGVPVATFAVGEAGAKNAALHAAAILAVSNLELASRLADWRHELSASVDLDPKDEFSKS